MHLGRGFQLLYVLDRIPWGSKGRRALCPVSAEHCRVLSGQHLTPHIPRWDQPAQRDLRLHQYRIRLKKTSACSSFLQYFGKTFHTARRSGSP